MRLPRRRGAASSASGPPSPGHPVAPEVAVHHPGDLDQLRGAAEVRDDRLRVAARGRRRGPVGHHHAQQPLGPDRLGDQVRDQRGVDPAREPQHRLLEPGLVELATDERRDDPAGDVGIDRELLGQREQRLHGARGACPDLAHRSAATSNPGADPALARSVDGEPRPLSDQAAELPLHQLRALVAQQRQRDPLAPHVGEVHVHGEQALVEHRGPEDLRARGPDDLRTAPEREALVHAHAVAEHHERRRELRVGPHEPPPRARGAQAHLVRAREVPPQATTRR